MCARVCASPPVDEEACGLGAARPGCGGEEGVRRGQMVTDGDRWGRVLPSLRLADTWCAGLAR